MIRGLVSLCVQYRPALRTVVWLALLSVFWSSGVWAQLPPIEEDEGVTGFGLALRRLSNFGSFLYVTAHPDDENNALLAKLSRGQGYHCALLSLTRGDGGQNEIGSELFEALGVLRSEELAAVHRYDAVRQYFSRAFEFGYSFSVEETLQKWGREEILGDIVRVIRTVRPHVILTMNPSGAGGGQHHQASAQLAADAFRLAGDPSQYSDQIEEGLRPWRPLRLFHTLGAGMGSSRAQGDVQIDLGTYDTLLGETYASFGAKARNRHRSQGMNVLPQPGPMASSFFLVNSSVESSQIEDSFFDQIDVSLPALAGYDANLESSVILLEGYVNWASEAFSRSDFGSAVKAVMTGLELVRSMKDNTSSEEARFFLSRKEEDFLAAAEKGLFLYADAFVTNSDGTAVPGELIEVRVRFRNNSRADVTVKDVQILAPPDWISAQGRGSEDLWSFELRPPATAVYSQPFWYRDDSGVDRFQVTHGFKGIEAHRPALLKAAIQYEAFGVTGRLERTVQHRRYDAGYGQEQRMELKIVPRLSVKLSPDIAILRVGQAQPQNFEVVVTNHFPGPSSAFVGLEAPSGWNVEPARAAVSFTYENEVQTKTFRLAPPNGTKPSNYEVRAVVSSEGQDFTSGIREVSYPHIQTRYLHEPAKSKVVALNVEISRPLRVGYIMGVGDAVGMATEQLGASVSYLTEDDLSAGNLAAFDVIVTGVRAYLVREDLVGNNHRLLDYVRQGGHLVVQYNKYEFLRDQYAPYPVRINRPHDRVTVEESPVNILLPDHPLLNKPNRITESDWQGWVQERGLYFLGQWDSRFQPLLELTDPWPYNSSPKKGALVVADYGEGTYVYTGLAFFRQLPAGVPGAYRLWANLLSLKHNRNR